MGPAVRTRLRRMQVKMPTSYGRGHEEHQRREDFRYYRQDTQLTLEAGHQRA